MKKKLINEEVRRLQELAGIRPVKEAEGDIQDIVLDIADYAGSGQGEAEGLKHFGDEIKKMIEPLKADPAKLQALSKALEDYIQQSEGWSQEDVDLLNSYGLNLNIEIEDDHRMPYGTSTKLMAPPDDDELSE